MRIQVTKWHGCGNDFIIVDPAAVSGIANLERFIVSVCERHTGIGADGFIIARPGEMEYYNQDGSRAPMCGNGIRCYSAFCGIGDETEIATLAGPHFVSRTDSGYRVNMGKPKEDLALLGLSSPVKHEQIAGHDVSTLFMGTIHTCTYVKDAFGDIDEPGRTLCHHPRFGLQTNVNFVEVLSPHSMRVQTYERGCGVTLACGTGVCASVVQAIRDGLCASPVTVQLKAGQLEIEVDEDGTVFMTGPARKILEGEYLYDETA